MAMAEFHSETRRLNFPSLSTFIELSRAMITEREDTIVSSVHYSPWPLHTFALVAIMRNISGDEPQYIDRPW